MFANHTTSPRYRHALSLLVTAALLALGVGVATSADPSLSPVSAQVICPDASQEPNEDKDSAVPLLPPNRPPVVPTGLLAAICPAEDEDWYVFNAPGSSRIRVTLSDLPADYDIELHADAGVGSTVLAGSYQSGGADESLSHDIVFPQTLYVRVYGAAGVWSALSEYQLRVWFDDSPPDEGDCPDAFEPNDTLSTAWPITVGGSIDAFSCTRSSPRGDSDWFAFDVPQEGQEIQVALTEHSIDLDLRLHDPDGIDVAFSAQGQAQPETIRHVAARAGRYAVHVFPKSGASEESEPYRLNVSLGAGRAPCSDAYEPNDGFVRAAPIQPSQGVQARLCPDQGGRSDVDWYRLRAGRGDRLRVEMQSLPVPVTLGLWRPDGSYWGGKHSRGTNPTSFEATLDAEGDWRLALTPREAGAGDVDNTYFLIARLQQAAGGCFDSHEPNNESSEATSASFATYRGRLCDEEDEDWFVLQPDAGLAVSITLDQLSDDYDLFLYDGAIDLIASSERAGRSAENIAVARAGGGPIYVQVRGYDGAFDRSNDYRLRIEGVAPPSLGCGEPFEPNERPEDAFAIEPPRRQLNGWICNARDRDWFSVTAQPGELIDVRLFNLPADYELELYRPDGSRAAASENDGRKAETIVHEALAQGDYFVVVYGFAGLHDADEPYSLRVAVGEGPVTPCGEPHEPNDSFAAASPLPLLDPLVAVEAWICAAEDEDWYLLDLAEPTRVELRLSDLPADYELVVQDETATELARATRGGTQSEEIELTLPEGQNRIQVFGYDGAFDAATPYSLLIDSRADRGAGGCGESFEPNEGREDATSLMHGIAQDGYICDPSDVDWFVVEGSAGATYFARLDPPPGVDLELELYAGGELVTAFSRKGGGASELITHSVVTAGPLAWRIYGYEGAADTMNPYRLQVDRVEPSPPLGCGEWSEPNEEFDAAVDLPTGEVLFGRICDALDQDWFRVNLRPGQILDASLRDLPADYDLQIYDPAGNLVAEANAGGRASERLRYSVVSLGSHRLRVFGYGGAHDPNAAYALELSAFDRAALPSATPTQTLAPSPSPSPTATRTLGPRPSATASATQPPKPTGEASATAAPKPSGTATATADAPASATPTATLTVRPKPSATATPTVPAKPTATATATGLVTATADVTPSATVTITPSATPTATPTQSRTITPTATREGNPIASPTAAPTATPTQSQTPSPTASPTGGTPTPTATATATRIIDSSTGRAYLPMLLQGR
jgi:hypothetical protein